MSEAFPETIGMEVPAFPRDLLRRWRATALAPESVLDLRTISRHDPDFRKLSERSFMAPGRVKELIADDFEEMSSREAMQRQSLINATTLLSVWELERTIAIFALDYARWLVNSFDWWSGYPTDMIIDNFRPWSTYLALDSIVPVVESDPNSDFYEGCLLSFVGRQGSLKLQCQLFLKGEGFEPLCCHEIDFTRGRKLGDIAESYEYDTPWAFKAARFVAENSALGSADQVRMMLTNCGREICRRILPLMVALISSPFKKTVDIIDHEGRILERLPGGRCNERNFNPSLADIERMRASETFQFVRFGFGAETPDFA